MGIRCEIFIHFQIFVKDRDSYSEKKKKQS